MSKYKLPSHSIGNFYAMALIHLHHVPIEHVKGMNWLAQIHEWHKHVNIMDYMNEEDSEEAGSTAIHHVYTEVQENEEAELRENFGIDSSFSTCDCNNHQPYLDDGVSTKGWMSPIFPKDNFHWQSLVYIHDFDSKELKDIGPHELENIWADHILGITSDNEHAILSNEYADKYIWKGRTK